MTIAPWWVRDPARLEREETALQTAGLNYHRDEKASEVGLARYLVTLDSPTGPVQVTATYPDAYPYFKPMVVGPDIGMDHHWNPVTGEYCLLRQEDWRPVADTLAELLSTQWAKLLAANAGDGTADDGRLLEVDQAEPVTAYMQVIPGSHLVLDVVPDLPGDLDYGPAGVLLSRENPPRGFVGNFIGADEQLLLPEQRFFAGPLPGLQAWWVRLREPLPSIRPEDVWAAVRKVAPTLDKQPWVPWPSNANKGKVTPLTEHVQLLLVRFPEEVERRETGMGWVALLRTRQNQRKPARRPRLVRIMRAGPFELLQRTPEMTAMRGKSVLLVGGGGLGSALTLLIAQMCPREFAIIDGDEVDAATAVRFPSASRFARAPKTEALTQLVCETQAYTNTARSLQARIGLPRWDGKDDRNLHEEVRNRVAAADIVVDATADTAVQHYLSDLARECGTAYLQAEGTPGVWGGLVALYPPDTDACWMCLQHHLDRTMPPLPSNTAAGVQPPGCAQPTYTGTGFDLTTIAAHAARVMAAYLTGYSGYGTFSDNLFTVELRDASGQPIAAKWTARQLTRHPDCGNHTGDTARSA